MWHSQACPSQSQRLTPKKTTPDLKPAPATDPTTYFKRTVSSFVTPGKRMTSIIYFRAQSAHEKLRLFTFSTGGLCIVTSQSKQCHNTGRGRRHTVCFHLHLHRNTNVCQKHIHRFPSLLRTLGYFPDSEKIAKASNLQSNFKT